MDGKWKTKTIPDKEDALLYLKALNITQNFDIKRVQTFKRNVQNIIAVALDHNICPIIVNWECDWESELEIPYFISSDKKYLSNKIKKYLHANNMALKELAEEKNIHFIESGPFSSDCFSDKIHFNGNGTIRFINVSIFGNNAASHSKINVRDDIICSSLCEFEFKINNKNNN